MYLGYTLSSSCVPCAVDNIPVNIVYIGIVRTNSDMPQQSSFHTTFLLRLVDTFQGNTSRRRSAQILIDTFPLRSSYKMFDQLMVDRCPVNILCICWSSAGRYKFLHYTIHTAYLQSYHFLLHQADMLKYKKRILLRCIGTESFQCSGPHLWNKLPVSLRTACSLSSFKHNFHTYIVTNLM